MDNLQFTVELAKALAWPLAVVFVAMMFKGRLENLLDKIKHAKGAGFEVDFSQGIQKVSEEAKQVEAKATAEAVEYASVEDAEAPEDVEVTEVESAVPSLEEQKRVLDLMQSRPAALILETWRDIERLVQDVAAELTTKLAPAVVRSAPPMIWLRRFSTERILTHEEAGVITDLKALRDKVANTRDFEPSKEDAFGYYQTGLLIITLLRKRLAELRALKK